MFGDESFGGGDGVGLAAEVFLLVEGRGHAVRGVDYDAPAPAVVGGYVREAAVG